jgi:hypothetical protein
MGIPLGTPERLFSTSRDYPDEKDMDDFERYDDPIDTDEELRESYPFLYDDLEKPYEPPGYRLSPKHQNFLDEQRAKLADRREFEDEFGEEYQHSIDDPTDEMLPTLNFRRCDNLFLARPANAFLEPGENAGPVKRQDRTERENPRSHRHCCVTR